MTKALFATSASEVATPPPRILAPVPAAVLPYRTVKKRETQRYPHFHRLHRTFATIADLTKFPNQVAHGAEMAGHYDIMSLNPFMQHFSKAALSAFAALPGDLRTKPPQDASMDIGNALRDMMSVKPVQDNQAGR